LALFIGIPLAGHVLYWTPAIDNLPVGILSYISTKPRLALFPFVPYSTWIALGLFVGPFWFVALSDAGRERRFWGWLVIAALALCGVARGIEMAYYALGFSSLGSAPPMSKGVFHVFLSKAVIVFFLFFVFWATRSMFDRRRPKILTLFGKASLFAYSVHLFFVYHTIGKTLGRSLSPVQHALAAAGLTALMYLLCRVWKHPPPGKMKRLWGKAVGGRTRAPS